MRYAGHAQDGDDAIEDGGPLELGEAECSPSLFRAIRFAMRGTAARNHVTTLRTQSIARLPMRGMPCTKNSTSATIDIICKS